MTKDAERERREIGQRLINYRVSKGYDKQGDFLREIQNKVKNGITQANLSHWETGKFKPEYEKLVLIKQAFPDFDPDQILYGEVALVKTDQNTDPLISQLMKRLEEAKAKRAISEAENNREIAEIQSKIIEILTGSK